jgi:hypothetical protein
MVLSVFGDESADETQQRVFAVSGIMGTESEWKLAEQAWVDRTGGKVFHAADCEYEKQFDLYKDLTQILANSYVAGIGIGLDLISLREFLPDVLPDAGYYVCFTKVIAAMARMARDWNETVSADPKCGDEQVQLEFTFDRRIESEQNAGRLYSTFINQPEWKNSMILDAKITFESRKKPHIQMADLIAREAMKDLDRKIGPNKFQERKSKIALKENGHFKFVGLDKAYCKLWRDSMAALEAESGISRDGYARWLSDTGRVQDNRPHDNWSNRALYLAWLDSREASP